MRPVMQCSEDWINMVKYDINTVEVKATSEEIVNTYEKVIREDDIFGEYGNMLFYLPFDKLKPYLKEDTKLTVETHAPEGTTSCARNSHTTAIGGGRKWRTVVASPFTGGRHSSPSACSSRAYPSGKNYGIWTADGIRKMPTTSWRISLDLIT